VVAITRLSPAGLPVICRIQKSDPEKFKAVRIPRPTPASNGPVSDYMRLTMDSIRHYSKGGNRYKYAPVKHVSTKSSAKCKRWYPAAVKRAVPRKRKAYDVNSGEIRMTRTHCRLTTKQVVHIDRKFASRGLLIHTNAGSYFLFVDGKLSCKRGLRLYSEGGDTVPYRNEPTY